MRICGIRDGAYVRHHVSSEARTRTRGHNLSSRPCKWCSLLKCCRVQKHSEVAYGTNVEQQYLLEPSQKLVYRDIR